DSEKRRSTTPSCVAILFASIGGIGFLTLSMKTLPVSVAYPIWTAIGTLGTVALGFVIFGESLTLLKIASALAIVLGVAGLKIASG
ncbi:MAG: SMR family transporter, partial [Pseudomonadota bacterium]